MTLISEKEAGVIIREARQRKGLTQGGLAERSRMSVSSVSAYERGKRRPRLIAAVRLADVLGFAYSDIYYISGKGHGGDGEE